MRTAAKTTIRLLLTSLLLTGCGATLPRVPAEGELHGQRVATTVDSPLARYYIERYLAGRRENAEWDARLDRLHGQAATPDTTQLQAVSREYSVDTAALFYALRLLEDPRNRALQAAFERRIHDAQAGALQPDSGRDYRIIVVPGWLHASKPWTGADFAKLRAMLDRTGVEHHFIELLDNGTVEDNARLLADRLSPLLLDERPTIIVSGSKGSPEVALALGEMLGSGQTKAVRAWINICGALQGSPLADKWTAWPVSILTSLLFRARGYGGLEGMQSLRMAHSRQRALRNHLPEHIQVVNYIGVPVSGTILDTEFEKRFTYVQLRDFGPNDGLVLIPDEVHERGVTVTELGRGHFLGYADFDQRATALLFAVMENLAAAQSLETATHGAAAAR